MTVGDLQQHLADLGRLLDSAGAKPVVTDLNAIRDGLAPFRALPLRAFAEFLRRAEAYSRGEVPITPPRPATAKASAKTQTPKAVAPSVDLLAREAEDVYERSSSPAVTAEQIEALVARLTPLSKDGVLVVAERVGLKGMKSKTKGDIQQAIRRRILDRKGAAIRVSMLDHVQPASPD